MATDTEKKSKYIGSQISWLWIAFGIVAILSIIGIVIGIVALTTGTSDSGATSIVHNQQFDKKNDTPKAITPDELEYVKKNGKSDNRKRLKNSQKETVVKKREARIVLESMPGRSMDLGKDPLKIRDGLYNIGQSQLKDGRTVQTILFVDDYIPKMSRPIQSGNVKNEITENMSLDCCEYISGGAHWDGVFSDIVFDTDNLDGLTDEFFNQSLTSIIADYNSANSNLTLIGDFSFAPLIISNPNNANGVNEAYFIVIESGAIAHALVHVDPVTLEILECDIGINVLFEFGDAQVNPNVIDLQSVLAHEIGHCLGLAHNNCADSTMFPTASEGEITKRDLTSDDLACVANLYLNGGFLESKGNVLKTTISLFLLVLAFFF